MQAQPETHRPLHFPSRSRDSSLSLICEFHQQMRYATPSGKGYLPLAFVAAHRRTRRAAEGGATAGFALFFFNPPSCGDDAASAANPAPPPTCRGSFFMREEPESTSELRELDVGRPPKLTITSAPPSILEEYLPLVKWWLPSRYRPLSLADHTAEIGREEGGRAAREGKKGAANPSRRGTTRLQLFLRDATSDDRARRRQQEQGHVEGEGGMSLVRQRTYTALAVYNSVSLLSSLPLSESFEGLVSLKLVGFPMSSLLWDSIGKAGQTLRLLNLSCCWGFADPLAEEAMRQLVKHRPGGGGGEPSASAEVGALASLDALVLPATDITNETLGALISATAPFHKVAYVNIGECASITDVRALVALKGSLRCLHAYSLPKLEAALALEAIGRCGADCLESLCLSRCQTITDLRYMGRLKRLRRLDLQGCTGLRSLSGITNADHSNSRQTPAAATGCVSLRQLWLTGCTTLALTKEEQQALFATCEKLEDLQLSYTPSLCSANEGTFTISTTVSHLSSLQSLSFAQCHSMKLIQLSLPESTTATLERLTMLDLSGTSVTTYGLGLFLQTEDNMSAHSGGDAEDPRPNRVPALHTLALNECRAISDFSLLRIPSLRRLSLAGTRVTSAHLESIATGCPALQALILNGCEAVSHFNVFPCFRALTSLSLAHTKVSNTALQYLLQIPFLQVLSLQDTAVTDLLKLAKAPYLRLVECGARKTMKNVSQLTKAGIHVDMEAAPPPLKPPMSFLSW